MLDEILTDAADNRPGQLFLISIVVQSAFLFRIGDECRFDQRRRNVRRLEHGESGLLDIGLVQRIDRPEFAEQILAQLQAIVDRAGLRQVEQRAGQEQILAANIHTTDQVGLVFLLGEQASLRAGSALFGQHED